MQQVDSVCVYPAYFDSHSFPIQMCDYHDADKAFAQDWNFDAEEAGVPENSRAVTP